MIDHTALQNELLNDPHEVGYADFIDEGNDDHLVKLLNAVTTTVQHDTLSKDQFLFAILPAILALSTVDEVTQKKWDRILMVAAATNAISVTSPAIQAVLGLAVLDGLLTVEQAGAVGFQPASRAEVLFGPDTIVTLTDISLSLRGDS